MRNTKIKTREIEAMRKHEMVPVTLPAAGLELRVCRQFQNGTHVFPVGSVIIDVGALGKNYTTLLAGHFLDWKPSDGKPPAQARTSPAPKAEPVRPAVALIDDPDPVRAWKLSVQSMTEKCGNNAALARDLLLAHREGSALYLRAQKIWCDSEAKRRGVVSVSPGI